MQIMLRNGETITIHASKKELNKIIKDIWKVQSDPSRIWLDLPELFLNTDEIVAILKPTTDEE